MTDSAVWTGYQEITISKKSIVSIKITYGNVFFSMISEIFVFRKINYLSLSRHLVN